MIRVFVAAMALGALCGCPGKDAVDGKRVMGAEGRERFVVTFDGADADLKKYHELAGDTAHPEDLEAFVDKQRAHLKDAHADLEGQVSALGGSVVEVWWMSNAITVEVEPGKADSLRAMVGKLGVKSITPDTPLAD